MRVIAKKQLRDYWQKEPETEQPLKAWYAEAEDAEWKMSAQVKEKYGNASILKNGRVVFNICGNKHRLVVKINYEYGMVYVRFIGTLKEYDKMDANTI